MAIQFTLKIEEENFEVIQQTFGAPSPEDIPQKILDYLLGKIARMIRSNAAINIQIDGDEIELDED